MPWRITLRHTRRLPPLSLQINPGRALSDNSPPLFFWRRFQRQKEFLRFLLFFFYYRNIFFFGAETSEVMAETITFLCLTKTRAGENRWRYPHSLPTTATTLLVLFFVFLHADKSKGSWNERLRPNGAVQSPLLCLLKEFSTIGSWEGRETAPSPLSTPFFSTGARQGGKDFELSARVRRRHIKKKKKVKRLTFHRPGGGNKK